jgi:hypothetical protein
MRKLILCILILICSNINSKAQSWEKLFSKSSSDVFRCVQQVSSGGYIVAGYTSDSTANDSDAYVVRLNSNGDTTWTYTYNGANSHKDVFYKVIEVSGGGFLALGYTNSTTPNAVSDDILYVKLTSSGHEEWVKTWGAAGTEHGQDVIETSNGFTIVGYTTPATTYYDALIINTDFNGNVNWTNTIGTTDYEDANAVKQLPDGGYILGGQCKRNNNFDMYVIRTKANGDTLWTRSFGTAGVDNIESIAKVGIDYVFAGGTSSTSTGSDGYVVKTDSSANVLWTKIYGGDDQDDFHRIEPTNDGGFILAGTCTSYGPQLPNLWLFKTDANGDSAWARTFGGDSHDHGYSAMQTNDGGYILAGHSGSFGYRNEDGYVIKVDANGTAPNNMQYIRPYELTGPLCTGQGMQDVKITVRNFGHTTETVHLTVDVTGAVTTQLQATINNMAPQTFQVVTLTPQINTAAGGSITFNAHTDVDNDVYPKLNSLTKTISSCTGIEDLLSLDYTVYPNPATDKINIQFGTAYDECKIELINNNGSIVKSVDVSKGSSNESISINNLAAGIYLMKVSTKAGFDLKKVMVN